MPYTVASGSGATVGDYPPEFQRWVDSVKRMGGAITVLPGTKQPAARYSRDVWVPRVNTREWPMPTSYSRDGQFAYYVASVDVQRAAKQLPAPSVSEIAAGAKQIREKYFSPFGVDLGDFGKKIAVWGVGALVGVVALNAFFRGLGARRGKP